jgi:hypothetical protein
VLLAPEIVITTQATPKWISDLISALTSGLILVATVVYTQRSTLRIFKQTQASALKKEQRDLENHREQERETVRLNLKREVFLEVAPAIQNNYQLLGAFIDFQLAIPDLQKKVRETYEKSAGAISKLTAVAEVVTIESARQVQNSLGQSCIRLMGARAQLGERKDLPAQREIVRLWKREIAPLPALLANLIGHARNELGLPFDKEQFEAGIADSNAKLFAEMEVFLGVL